MASTTTAIPAPTAATVTTGRVLGVGLIGGLFSGLLGVGGGIVMVPLLALWMNLGQRQAHAVSLGAIIPISIAGVATYGLSGHIDYPLAGALAVGSLAGTTLGTRLLVRVAENWLKIAFGALLVAVAITIGAGL